MHTFTLSVLLFFVKPHTSNFSSLGIHACTKKKIFLRHRIYAFAAAALCNRLLALLVLLALLAFLAFLALLALLGLLGRLT
jgi:hypothetical protein